MDSENFEILENPEQVQAAAPPSQFSFEDNGNIFLFSMLNISILGVVFCGGYLTREQFVLCTCVILILTRLINIIRPECDISEKYFFIFSHLLTLPALIERNVHLMLNAMNMLMFGRLILFTMVFYKVLLMRHPLTTSFITMAINNEGMLWSLRVLFRIAVFRTPNVSENMMAIANETYYF